MKTKVALLLTLMLLVACGAKQKAETKVMPKTVTVDGHERLPDTVVPRAYRLDLTIDPSEDRFSGRTVIDVTVAEPTDVITLHADELDITTAAFERGNAMLSPDVQPGENGGLALVFAQPVETGTATLIFEYSGSLDEVPTGLYRVKDGEQSYAFTQFEPLEARQAFPSFDEPRFKTPYEVTMRVPTGQLALTNTPEVERGSDGDHDVFKFQKSKPLPTYLVAFAVGDFDVVEAPADAIEGVPLRLIAVKGKGELGQFMLGEIPGLLERLSTYFDSKYPYAKLDVIAVPNFAAGAMENVGLVTFRESLLLLDPKTASVADKRSAIGIMVHELAHMWFGNSVTLPWWNDLWLNESFATWMAHKVLIEEMPELEADIDAILSVNWIIRADSRKDSRMIRQPITNGGEVYNAFDGITYGKGAAVLRMFEAWAGPEKFRDGIRAYLAANEHSTGTTSGLLAALDEASGKPVGEAMSTFLDQAGAPLLKTTLDCGEGAPKVTIEQERYRPAASEAAKTGPWHVPFCIAYREGRKTQQFCDLLTEPTQQFDLPAKKCPTWYYPNAGQSGYYRWTTDDENLKNLTGKRTFASLDDATRVEIFTDLEALAVAEKISAERWMETVDAMSSQKHRSIVRLVVGALDWMDWAVTEEQRPAFQKRVARILKPHMRRVGYQPKEDEAAEIALLRPRVFSASAKLADDEKALTAAREIADDFLANMSSVRVDMARIALPIAAMNGDDALWLSYRLALDNASNPAARVAVIRGLGSFRNPQLQQKSLSLFLDGTLRAQDMWTVLGPSFGDEKTFAVAWNWFTTHYDEIVEILGDESIPRLPRVGRGFCSEEGQKQVEEFFAVPERRRPGIERNLSQTLEVIGQCVRRKAYYAKGLDFFLN